MLISIEPHGIFRSNFVYSCMSTLSNHWHAQQPFVKDEALLRINLAGDGQLVKMLIPLEPRIFGSNFVYLYITTLYNHWYSKCRRGFTEHQFGQSRSFCGNAQRPHGIFLSNFAYYG